MIRLQTVEKPAQLTDELVAELTKKYKDDDSDVWKQTYIIEALSKMSANKCCFCETKLGEESKYMEVEHFHPKSLYPDEVVSWKNLLPICKRCNGKKKAHDTEDESIIHPVVDNPKEHLALKNYRFEGLTPLGKTTKDVVYLNDSSRLVNARFKIGEGLNDELSSLIESVNAYIEKPITRRKNKIEGTLRRLMLEGTKESEFSATAATILLENLDYTDIKQLFITHNLWTQDFVDLEKEVEYCALI